MWLCLCTTEQPAEGNNFPRRFPVLLLQLSVVNKSDKKEKKQTTKNKVQKKETKIEDIAMMYGNEVKTTSVFNGYHQVLKSRKIDFEIFIFVLLPLLFLKTLNRIQSTIHVVNHILVWCKFQTKSSRADNQKRGETENQ